MTETDKEYLGVGNANKNRIEQLELEIKFYEEYMRGMQDEEVKNQIKQIVEKRKNVLRILKGEINNLDLLAIFSLILGFIFLYIAEVITC